MTSDSGSCTGIIFSITAFTRLKIAVLAPTPMAMERRAAVASAGERRSQRRP